MTTPRSTFDWTAWYAKIPGIPTDWGFRKLADCAAVSPDLASPQPRYAPQLQLAQ